MLVLDTNVLAALMLPSVPRLVVEWLARQEPAELHTTAVTEAETLAGLAAMPGGQRRAIRAAVAHEILNEDLAGRVLTFDRAAALAYAGLYALRQRAGLGVATADLVIAAIAFVYGAAVVTRNTSDFAGLGLDLINPWAA
ncbi:MAG: PIN domain-containing protein [Terriglobales bacterium]